jgi:multidrug efflux pump subunit AcrA (membrane-fusion protein)
MIRKYGVPLAAVLMLLFAVYQVVQARQKPPRLEPPVPPARSPFGGGVAGAGLVEARTENIAVGSNLPGIVTRVHVSIDQPVKAGDLLFELDRRQAEADLEVRQAGVEVAREQMRRLEQQPRPEEVPPSEAQVKAAEATVRQMADQCARDRRLSRAALADQDRVAHEQSYQQALAQLEVARSNLALLKAGAWKPDKAIARATLRQAQAQVTQARTNLELLQIRAPVDGTVLQVNVRPGESVAAAPGAGLILMGNLRPFHVRVDIDEHDIPQLPAALEKASARAMLRGDPGQQFPLRYVRVEPYVIPKKSLTGDNTERVDTRVLQVIYALEQGSRRVYAGQQLDVFIEGTPRKEGA